MWNHSPHIISESAQLLALCHILPLWPEAFWLESISESTSKKWASVCAGLHRACDAVRAASLICHVLLYCIMRNDLACNWLHVLPKAFTLHSQQVAALLQVAVKWMHWRSGRWCSLSSCLCPFRSAIISLAESLNLRSSSGLLPSTLMDIYCAWATLGRQDFASLNMVLGKSSLTVSVLWRKDWTEEERRERDNSTNLSYMV